MAERRIVVLRYAPLCVAAALCLTACDSGPKTRLLENKDAGWTFPIPTEYQRVSANLPTGYLQYATPYVDKKRTTLLISSVPDSQTPAEEGADIVKNPPEGLSIQNNGPYAVAGADGYSIVATRNDGKETQHQIIIKGPGLNVTMTLTCTTAEFEKRDQAFRDCLKSFHWTP